jgi:hypothetical protein
MKTSTKLFVSAVSTLGIVLLARHGAQALQPALPRDMPSGSHFAQFGYDIRKNEPKGVWVACRPESDQSADFCRVTDAHGIVIFQGDFLPLRGTRAVSQANLQFDGTDPMWVRGPAEGGPVPVLPLADGMILVPAADSDALADRWEKDPDELTRLAAQ